MIRQANAKVAVTGGKIVITRTEAYTPDNEMEAVSMLRDLNTEIDRHKRQRAELNLRITELEAERDQLQTAINTQYPPKPDTPIPPAGPQS